MDLLNKSDLGIVIVKTFTGKLESLAAVWHTAPKCISGFGNQQNIISALPPLFHSYDL